MKRETEETSITNNALNSNLMTSQQVADYFQKTLPTIWAWRKNNLLKAYKKGNSVYYKRSEIENGLIQISGK